MSSSADGGTVAVAVGLGSVIVSRMAVTAREPACRA
jgi:hypothetical protein